MLAIRLKTARTCLIYLGLMYFLSSMSDGIAFNSARVHNAVVALQAAGAGPSRVPAHFN